MEQFDLVHLHFAGNKANVLVLIGHQAHCRAQLGALDYLVVGRAAVLEGNGHTTDDVRF